MHQAYSYGDNLPMTGGGGPRGALRTRGAVRTVMGSAVGSCF